MKNKRPYINPDAPRVTKNLLADALRAVGIAPGDTVFVHASLSAFGEVDGGANTVCDALLETVGPQGTLAMPTFTWNRNIHWEFVQFDVRRDACETGAIPETFRKRTGVQRSGHVCHSVAALGPHADAVMGDGILPFGKGSSLYALYERHSWNLLLGVSFGVCTALHTAEELAQVPYRYYRHYQGSTVRWPDGRIEPARALEYCRRKPYNNDFAKMHPVFENAGLLRTAQVGNAKIINAPMRNIVDIALDMLRTDPGALLSADSYRYFQQERQTQIKTTPPL